MSSFSIAQLAGKPVTPDNSTYGGSLARLREIAWKGKPENLFHSISVTCDAQLVRAKLPKNLMALQWDRNSASTVKLFKLSQLSAILVRDEYRSMLQDIIDNLGLGRDGANQSNNNEDDAAIDVDAEPFHNPFVDLPSRAPTATGAIVIGSPGIGKSTFLIYILALRLLAGQTTTFQRNHTEIFILNDEGVFQISRPITTNDNLDLYLPRGTWFLVDSNQSLTDVPPIYLDLGSSCRGFILQAASPRSQRVDWRKKAARRVPQFWMAPWSLGELIAGRDLQLWEDSDPKPSVQDLALFSRLYGTSARHAYAYAGALDEYESQVDDVLAVLNKEKMAAMLRGAASVNMDETISHILLVATPSPRNRKKFDLQIATKHLSIAVLDELSSANDQAADTLYQLFLRNPYTRAGAGYLLEGAFLAKFPNGGEWPVTAMQKTTRAGTKNTHWRSNGTNLPKQYLRLGFQGRIIDIEDNQIGAAAEFRRLDRHHFSLRKEPILEDGFFVPRSKSQPTFDAFVYDAGSQRATIFQVTVSDQLAISTLGLDWLLDVCDVKSVDLIVVTPPLGGRIIEDIWVANSHRDKLGKVYVLELHDLMECTVAELKIEELNMEERERGELGKLKVEESEESMVV